MSWHQSQQASATSSAIKTAARQLSTEQLAVGAPTGQPDDDDANGDDVNDVAAADGEKPANKSKLSRISISLDDPDVSETVVPTSH